MTPNVKKEEIKATILVYHDNEYNVEIPSSEYWTNNIETNFIICFRTSIEKHNFLEEYQRKTDFRIDCYIYSKCRIFDISDTNMIKCYALRNYDDTHLIEEFFNEKVLF